LLPDANHPVFGKKQIAGDDPVQSRQFKKGIDGFDLGTVYRRFFYNDFK
jgi:hypothetical protein